MLTIDLGEEFRPETKAALRGMQSRSASVTFQDPRPKPRPWHIHALETMLRFMLEVEKLLARAEALFDKQHPSGPVRTAHNSSRRPGRTEDPQLKAVLKIGTLRVKAVKDELAIIDELAALCECDRPKFLRWCFMQMRSELRRQIEGKPARVIHFSIAKYIRLKLQEKEAPDDDGDHHFVDEELGYQPPTYVQPTTSAGTEPDPTGTQPESADADGSRRLPGVPDAAPPGASGPPVSD